MQQVERLRLEQIEAFPAGSESILFRAAAPPSVGPLVCSAALSLPTVPPLLFSLIFRGKVVNFRPPRCRGIRRGRADQASSVYSNPAMASCTPTSPAP